jgi:hypothetical protein
MGLDIRPEQVAGEHFDVVVIRSGVGSASDAKFVANNALSLSTQM